MIALWRVLKRRIPEPITPRRTNRLYARAMNSAASAIAARTLSASVRPLRARGLKE